MDGELRGNTGRKRFEIPAGAREIRLLEASTGEEHTYQVQVHPDATITLGCWDFRAGRECEL